MLQGTVEQTDVFASGRRYVAGLTSAQETLLRQIVIGLKAGGDLFKPEAEVATKPLGEIVVPPEAPSGLKVTDVTVGPATYSPESLPGEAQPYSRELRDGEVAAKVTIKGTLGQTCATYIFERQASGELLPSERVEHFSHWVPC